MIKSIKLGGGEDAENGPAGPNAPPGANASGAHGGDSPAKPRTTVQTITWEASDPNNDALSYSLFFRLEPSGEWILLKAKLKEPTFDWDTRSVADGRYQVKVVASDAASNPPGDGKTASRVSTFFVINNTPPTIGDLAVRPAGNDVKVDLRVQDHISIIANVEYSVDSSDDWQAVLPVDNIFDSTDEKVSFTIKSLAAGSHQITIRATDSRGNQALQTEVIKIAGPTAQTPGN